MAHDHWSVFQGLFFVDIPGIPGSITVTGPGHDENNKKAQAMALSQTQVCKEAIF